MTPDVTVAYWNRGAEAVFGYASSEAVRCLLNEIIVPLDRLEEERNIVSKTLEAAPQRDLNSQSRSVSVHSRREKAS